MEVPRGLDIRGRRQGTGPQLQVRGFQRSVRIPDPSRAARREGGSPPRVHQRVEPRRLPPDQPRRWRSDGAGPQFGRGNRSAGGAATRGWRNKKRAARFQAAPNAQGEILLRRLSKRSGWLRRRRSCQPIAPKPRSIIAQVPGSGTPWSVIVIVPPSEPGPLLLPLMIERVGARCSPSNVSVQRSAKSSFAPSVQQAGSTRIDDCRRRSDRRS